VRIVRLVRTFFQTSSSLRKEYRPGQVRTYAHFPVFGASDAAETDFPGRSIIRRTELVRIVRSVRTFFQNQQPAQKGISSSVISVPANSSCCTGAR
jgi:hypothetical protein